MSTSKLILVTGAPATGKTSIANRIAERFKLPQISKDDLKEMLFDDIGWSDRAWSKKIGKASYDIMYYLLDRQLSAEKSLVMESDFRPEYDTPRLQELKNKYGFDFLCVHCASSNDVMLERFQARLDSGKRHPGHDDHNTIKEFTPEVISSFSALDIGGQIMEIDTTDFSRIEFELVWQQIGKFLQD